MEIHFCKYQGTGNDFIIINNKNLLFPKNDNLLINKLCNRNYGIGADGLILIENDKNTDFKMVYFNSDGNESSMCGNGGRCIVAFANRLGIINKKTTFSAIDGKHKAFIYNDKISLQMINVNKVDIYNKYVFTNTGSPHHVQLVNNIDNYDVFNMGKKIRNSLYSKHGCNINFVEQVNNTSFKIRTYERGVENETLACGTGAVAVAIAMHATKKTKDKCINLKTKGGCLNVSFNIENSIYKKIFLSAPANYVFNGYIKI